MWPFKKNKNLKKDFIDVVIPVRKGETAKTTLDSLKNQTFKNFETIVIYDSEQRGANWARNAGFKVVKSEFVLFSDNDIEWEPNGIENLFQTLKKHPEASYSYGSYEMNDNIQCWQDFDPKLLRIGNYISTMSLIRSKDFPGFDEKIQRLQDWDLWLNMLSKGKIGVQCGNLIFKTKPSLITRGDPSEAVKIIQKKWKL